jgi:hypothetical protein
MIVSFYFLARETCDVLCDLNRSLEWCDLAASNKSIGAVPH